MNQVDRSASHVNEEDSQLARVLSILIWASWGVYLFVILTGLYFKDRLLIAVTLAGCALLGVPMLLLRRGKLHASSLVVMLIELVTVTIIATFGQGIRDLAVLAYPIIFIFAGLALNRSTFRIAVGLTLVAVCWLVLGEEFGLFMTKPFLGDLTNWFYLLGVTLILLVAALAVDLLATKYRKSLAQAHEEIAQRERLEKQKDERLKELQALFTLSRLIEKDSLILDELFQEYVNILPQSWQYPEIACARIVIGNHEFHSRNFVESTWMQSAPIKVKGSNQGRIEVGYMEARPEDYEGPFLNEERMLLDAIAERLGRVTERKRAEQQLKEYSDQLEEMVAERTRELQDAHEQLVRKEKLAVLGQMAGSVSHELRNPLGIINNAIYYLKLVQPEADEKVKEHLALIEKEVQTADKIITDLLDFARIKPVTREHVPVPQLVERVLGRFPVPASVEVALNIPADLPLVHVDPGQVEQVLGNLTVNACQAMKAGGKLTIRGDCFVPRSDRRLPRREEHPPRNDNRQQWVRIDVKDTGTGIPPENLQKIFEPLFTTRAKGFGLGLAVSQLLAQANGGRIEVQSQPGEGSTFMLYLPVKG